MATQRIALTSTPQKLTDGTAGIRMQNLHTRFCWAASATQPTDLSLCHRDFDAYVEGKGPIWAWVLSKDPLNIIVTP